MSLLDVGKNLFNSGKKAATDFLTQYPTPASYIQAKANPVISPVPQTQQITPQDNRGIWATPVGRGIIQAQNNIQTAYNNPVVQQSIRNSVPWLSPLNPFKGFTEQLLPTAIQTGVNAGLEKVTGNPMTFNVIPQSTLESYSSSGPLGKMQPVLTGGLQTLNAAMGALSAPAAATNPLTYAKTTALWNTALQGSGELAKGIREGKSAKEITENIFKASVGQGKTSGPFSGIFGENGLAQAADMALSIGLPLVIHGKTSELTNVPKEVQSQLRDARGKWVEGQKPIKPPKQTQAQWKFQLEFNKKYGRNPYEIVTNDDLRKALKIEAEKRIGMQARPVGADTIASRTQSSKVPQVEQKTIDIQPTQTPISNKPLSSNALPKSIPLTSKSTPQEVAASLQSRVDDFVQKTLGYSTKDPTGGKKGASLWTRTLRKGEEAFTSSVEKGLSSENTLVRNAASTLQNFFRGAGMSTERSQASMGLRGEMAVGTQRAYDVMESLYKALGNDKKSLERINAVLDPDISKVKVTFDQLSDTEKQVYGILREGLDIVHDTSYANGNITPEMYKANKGKYTPRMYEPTELPPEVNKFISQGKKIVNDLYKKRKDITDWKVDNSLNDPVYALGKRLAQVETNNAVKKYVGYLASNPQFVSDIEKPGFVKLSDSPAYGQLKGKYVLNSAAEDLKGFFFASEGLDKLYDVFKIYDRLPIRQLQKKLLTVFNPTTNVGNIVSDQIFGFVTGVDPFTLNRNLLRLKNNPSEFKQLSDYLMRKGIVGTDITRTDFVNRMGQIDSLASGAKKGVFARISDKATSFYGGTDDAYKITALKSLLEKGFSLEEATRKVSDGFQNYANVGKFYDVWSKTPIVGSTFIKFQGDLMRIIKNGAVNNPLGLITFLGTLAGVARLSSKLSGETDSDRIARENRFAAPMIPGLNIPLTWQTPMGEINVARYISPFFANNDVTNLSKMFPFIPNIDTKKDVATNIALNANDPLTATAVQLAVNRDFRGKNIADPKENKYQPSTLTPEERLKNQAIFGARGYTPPLINSAIDVAAAAQGKPNQYGAKQSVPQALARMAGIKIQKYGPEEVAKAQETNDKFQESKNEAIDRQINDVYKQQLKNEISPEQVAKRIQYLESQKVGLDGKTSGIKEDIFRYLDKNGKMQSIDMNFQPTEPEKTGLEELDKKAISKFYGEITSKANDIYTLYKEGAITQEEANDQLSKLKTLKSKYGGSKKAPKITVKKISTPKLKVIKSKPIKVANFKIKSPSMPKTKKTKAYKVKNVKPIKIAKLTIKSKNV